MRYHVCSHYGDIEFTALEDDRCKVVFWKLTSMETVALDLLLSRHAITARTEGEGEKRAKGDKAERVLNLPIMEAGRQLAELIHGAGAPLLTGIKFAKGKVKVVRDAKAAVLLVEAGVGEDGEPESAVTVEQPTRGCPMPTVTEMREQRAADVVRSFLTSTQRQDFDKSRSILSQGCDTGALYRITSRWSPDVEHYGALYRLTQPDATRSTPKTICASNLNVPPSEEMLSLKFAVETVERSFLRSGDH